VFDQRRQIVCGGAPDEGVELAAGGRGAFVSQLPVLPNESFQ